VSPIDAELERYVRLSPQLVEWAGGRDWFDLVQLLRVVGGRL
jgi:hypothetical protein